MFVLSVLSLEDECVPLSQIYLLSYSALLVLRVCVGCHKRCPSTYLLPLFSPNLSFVLDSCDHLLCPNVSRYLLTLLVRSCLRHSSLCFFSFIFQSQSGNLLHHFFHHLLKPFHFFHQTLHLCASLARKHKTLPSSLSPCLTTPRAHKMDPTTTVAAYQMLANCYLSLLRCYPKKSITTRWIYNVTKTMDLQSMYTQMAILFEFSISLSRPLATNNGR